MSEDVYNLSNELYDELIDKISRLYNIPKYILNWPLNKEEIYNTACSVLDKFIQEDKILPVAKMVRPYLIEHLSLKDLMWYKHKWHLADTGIYFSSLRIARTYIKKNIGRLELSLVIPVAGQIEGTRIAGTLSMVSS